MKFFKIFYVLVFILNIGTYIQATNIIPCSGSGCIFPNVWPISAIGNCQKLYSYAQNSQNLGFICLSSSSNCPNGSTTRSNITQCVPCSGSNSLFDTSTGNCVATCPAAAPETQGKYCVPCSSTTPYWNTGVTPNACTACPLATPYWNTGVTPNACTVCPSTTPYWNETACVSCASVNPLKPLWNGTTCVACASNQFPNATGCTTCASPTPTPNLAGTACVSCAQANQANPYWNTTVTPNACTACPSTTPYWNGASCVSCASVNPLKPLWNGTTCVACASNQFPNATGCTTCASPTPTPNLAGTACVSCASVNPLKPLWNGTACVACASNQYWNTGVTPNSCTTCASSTPMPNLAGNGCTTCAMATPATPYWNTKVTPNTCTACAAGLWWAPSSTGGSCQPQTDYCGNAVGTEESDETNPPTTSCAYDIMNFFISPTSSSLQPTGTVSKQYSSELTMNHSTNNNLKPVTPYYWALLEQGITSISNFCGSYTSAGDGGTGGDCKELNGNPVSLSSSTPCAAAISTLLTRPAGTSPATIQTYVNQINASCLNAADIKNGKPVLTPVNLSASYFH